MTHRSLTMIAVATLALLAPQLSVAAPAPRGAEAGTPLVPSAVAPTGEFGEALAVSGDGLVAVVGAPGDVVGEVASGSATVFRLSGEQWVEVGRLTPPEPAAGMLFGDAVAIDQTGATIAVGMPDSDDGQGAVAVFTGPDYDPADAVTIPAPGVGEFGRSLALDDGGSRLVIGEPGIAGQVGSAWVASGPAWAEDLVELTREQFLTDDDFGASVAIADDGQTIAVGAPGPVSEELPGGAAFVYFGDALDAPLAVTPPEPQQGDRIGAAVALDAEGTRLLVGAPGANAAAGAVWRFDKANEFAAELAATLPIEAEPETGVGSAIALSDDGANAVVGARSIATWHVTSPADPAEGEATPLPGNGVAVSISDDGGLCLISQAGSGSTFAAGGGSAAAAAFRHFGSVSGTVEGEFDPDPPNGFRQATTGEAIVLLCVLVGQNAIYTGALRHIDSAGGWAFPVPQGATVRVVAMSSVTIHSVMPGFSNPAERCMDQGPHVMDVTAPTSDIVLQLPKEPLGEGEMILEGALRQDANLPPGTTGPVWTNLAGPTNVAFQACAGATSATATVRSASGRLLAQVPLTENPTNVPPGTSRYTGTIPVLSEDVQEVTVTAGAVCPDGSTPSTSATAFLDPSGTVVDEFGRPLDGATVSLYRQADGGALRLVPDRNGPDCFPTVEPTCQPVMDPAVNDVNPDVTGVGGGFHWETIPGTYALRATRPGCHQPGDPDTPFTDDVILPDGQVVTSFDVPPERVDLTMVLDCDGEAPPFDGEPDTIDRIDEGDPIAAAVAVSQARFPDPAARPPAHVVLARSDDFADSLAGTALTGEAPLLLTPSEALDPATRAEVDRLLGGTGIVFVLGGPVAIAGDVEAALIQAGYDVQRLAGPTRVETAVDVADAVRASRASRGTVMLARADAPADNPTAAWADSVTGGAWAARSGIPVLVTQGGQLHPAVVDWLAADDPTTTVLLGGPAALSSAIADAVPDPQRIAGSERAGTAAAIATDLFTTGPIRLHLLLDGFRTDGFAFGLPAAGLAADRNAPILLVNDGQVPDATGALLCGSGAADLAVLGDTTIVDQTTVTAVQTAAAAPCPSE